MEWVCDICGHVETGYPMSLKCPKPECPGFYVLREKVVKPNDGSSFRAGIVLLTGAAIGLYVWSATKDGGAALIAAIIAGAIASREIVNKLIAWALVIGIGWFLYEFSKMT